MKDGKCSKRYPRAFTEVTSDAGDGYPLYARPDNGRGIDINGVRIDNRWVVPHNPVLLKKYNAHINVEVSQCPTFCRNTIYFEKIILLRYATLQVPLQVRLQRP